MSTTWSDSTTNHEAFSRASGRRQYNAQRQHIAAMRQAEVFRRAMAYGYVPGTKARIARELGVHRSTVTRDFRAAIRRLNDEEGQR